MNSTIKKIIKKIIRYDKLLYIKYKIETYINKNRKVSGHSYYTVVSAVYNVEKYLDQYFKSLVGQTLKFGDHIHLILVDDGSPDNSADIIKKWQLKYPNNITYIKKENGGQASARNEGLKYVNTEWVTFVDPDDFLDCRYFEIIDTFLVNNKNKKLVALSCNFIFYHEKNKHISDAHPLKYRFEKSVTILPTQNLQEHIQLSVNSVIFKTSELQRQKIYFDTRIKPNFEDAHFVNRFLLNSSNTREQFSIAFLKNAKYYYRKRADGTSTLDTGWQKKEMFYDVLLFGCLDLLKYTKSTCDSAPIYIQRAVLYHLVWYYRHLINHNERVSFLSEKEKNTFLSLVKEIFTYIDINTIESFELAGCDTMHKVGFIEHYKNKIIKKTVFIDDYDENKQEMKLHYFYTKQSNEVIILDGKKIKPSIEKIRNITFLNDVFVYEKIEWIPVNSTSKILEMKSNGLVYEFNFRDTLHQNFFELSEFFTNLKQKSLFFRTIEYAIKPFSYRYKDAWLLMDRDTQADDNAEHLYRYIMHKHPEINQFFVLRKDSHDWERLENEGFRLIAFGSTRHKLLYLNAKHLISSHGDNYVQNYLPQKYFKDILKFKYTFLQHGITQNNISNWLNSKKIDCFVVASPLEYNSIANDHTYYKFSIKEVKLTGFPRHDRLLTNFQNKTKTILIMPTWRQSLVGYVLGKGNTRALNDDFTHTNYFHYWNNLIHSKNLQRLTEDNDYNIIFFLHANIQPYLKFFNIPKYIKTINHSHGSIQDLFKEATFMITDYSSVAFEMGIQYKETIYYQFDHQEVFSGGHISQKGYFDYERNGFGPVCFKEKEVISELKKLLENDREPSKIYLQRMQKFFAFHDTNNCQRVFEAIEDMDNPRSVK